MQNTNIPTQDEVQKENKKFWILNGILFLSQSIILWVGYFYFKIKSASSYYSLIDRIVLSNIEYETFNNIVDYSRSLKSLPLEIVYPLLGLCTIISIALYVYLFFIPRDFFTKKRFYFYWFIGMFLLQLPPIPMFILGKLTTDFMVFLNLTTIFFLILTLFFERKSRRNIFWVTTTLYILFFIFFGLFLGNKWDPFYSSMIFMGMINIGEIISTPISFFEILGVGVIGSMINFFFFYLCIGLIRQISIQTRFTPLKRKLQLIIPLIILFIGISFLGKTYSIKNIMEYTEKSEVVKAEFWNFYDKNIVEKSSPRVLFIQGFKSKSPQIIIEDKSCKFEIFFSRKDKKDIKNGSLDCNVAMDFWNKKQFLLGQTTDQMVDSIVYFLIRENRLNEAFKITNEPIKKFLKLAFDQNINSIRLNHFVSAVKGGFILQYYGVLSPEILSYYKSIQNFHWAEVNMLSLKRAGLPFDIKKCLDNKNCKDYIDLIVKLGYTKEEVISKNKFPLGTLHGKIFINSKPFNGYLELFRNDINYINTIFALRGMIPVKNGVVQKTPIMIGDYRVGIRLDDYFIKEKDEDIMKKYEITGKNLPDSFIINDDNRKVDLGKIEINILPKRK